MRFDLAATGLHPTLDQTRTLVERSSKLRRKLLAWIDIQRGFFPTVDRIRTLEDDARAQVAKTQPIAGVRINEMSLWLPSAMMKQAGSREISSLLKDSVHHEYRLRVGQANEALHEIRYQLLVRSHLYQVKDAYSRGVRENTRSGGKIELCDDRIRRMTAQYRTARLALVVLGRVLGREEWQRTLKPLLDGDVRGMPHAQFGDPERQKGGKGKKQKRRIRRSKRAKVDKPPPVLSWIWIAQARDPEPGSSQAMNEAVRIEWAKARARAMRWTEEVDLLEEEMRRILQFLAWRGDWWEAQIAQRGLGDGPQLEGETAYATRQAALQRELRDRFSLLWKHLPDLIREGRAAVIAARTAVMAEGRGAAGEGDAGQGDGAGGKEDDDEDEEEEVEGEVDEGASVVPPGSLNPIDPLYLNT